VPVSKADAFVSEMNGIAVTLLGKVSPLEVFRITGRDGVREEASLSELKEAWQRTLRW